MDNLGIIELMRGDSFSSPIIINLGNKLYPNYYQLKNDDKLYFGVMEPGQAFEDAVIKKVYTISSKKDSSGNVLLELEPKDTEKLLVGKYYYMIKLVTLDENAHNKVRTIVPPTLFWLYGNNPINRTEEIKYKVIFDGGEVTV